VRNPLVGIELGLVEDTSECCRVGPALGTLLGSTVGDSK